MKLQFRDKNGNYMFELLDQAAYNQLENLKQDKDLNYVQKTFKNISYDCFVVTKPITYVFMRFVKVILSEGDYIKIINL